MRLAFITMLDTETGEAVAARVSTEQANFLHIAAGHARQCETFAHPSMAATVALRGCIEKELSN